MHGRRKYIKEITTNVFCVGGEVQRKIHYKFITSRIKKMEVVTINQM